MITFVVALLLLFVGYQLYGRVAERVFRPDDRPPPPSTIPMGSTTYR